MLSPAAKGGKGKGKQSKLGEIEASLKVWVGTIGEGTDSEQLQAHFEESGFTCQYVECWGAQGCVAFNSADEVEGAIASMNGTELNGKDLSVDVWTEKPKTGLKGAGKGKNLGKKGLNLSAGAVAGSPTIIPAWNKQQQQQQQQQPMATGYQWNKPQTNTWNSAGVGSVQNSPTQWNAPKGLGKSYGKAAPVGNVGGCEGGKVWQPTVQKAWELLQSKGFVKGELPAKGKGKGKTRSQRLKQFANEQKVWVGSLPEGASWKELQELFNSVGETAWIELLPKGVACVVYKNEEDVNGALALSGSEIDGQAIEVDVWTQMPKTDLAQGAEA